MPPHAKVIRMRAGKKRNHVSAESTTKKPCPPARERILVAALREFGEKGFAGACVEMITRAAKANRQLIYHYFGNKEALFKSVLELAYREV